MTKDKIKYFLSVFRLVILILNVAFLFVLDSQIDKIETMVVILVCLIWKLQDDVTEIMESK